MKPSELELNDNELLEIDFALIAYLLKRHLTLILCLVIVCMVIGLSASFLLHKNRYRSEATVLLDSTSMPNIVANFRHGDSFFKGFTTTSDPFKNQEALLKSHYLANRVYKDLQSGRKAPSLRSASELLDEVLTVQHIRGTDFIRLVVTWHNPKEAQEIAKAYLRNYISISEEITHAPMVEQRKNLQAQVEKAEKELESTNEQIRQFQEAEGVVDISREGGLLLARQDAQLREIETLEAAMAEKKGEIEKLQSQLQLDTQSAILSVANGQNRIYTNLMAELNTTEQDYNIKSLVYAPTNPEMVKLKEKIAVLKDQMAHQELLTIGRPLKSTGKVIADDVRRELVKRLALLEAEYTALKQKREVNQKQLSLMDSTLSQIPTKQIAYARLLLDQKNQEEILNRLKQSLAEAKIQETSLHKKIHIVDPPTLPKAPVFPNRFDLLLLTALGSLVVPTGTVISLQYLRNQIARPQFLENILNVPVLCVIPWLTGDAWSSFVKNSTSLKNAGAKNERILSSYQSLALSLKIQGAHQGKKALAIAAVQTEDTRHRTIITNLALCLAQSGDRVVMVDANLRKPGLHEMFGESLNYEQGLTETINDLADHIFRAQTPVNPEALLPLVESRLMPTPIHENVFYINAGIAMQNTFEFLNSKGFEALVGALKTSYDWILFDTPSLLQGSDAYVVLRHLDGLLMVVERHTSKQQVELAVRKLRQVQGPIVGAVMRDLDEENPLANEFFEH